MSLSQKIRASIIHKCYQDWIPSGRKVLDVGCGNAIVSKQLKEKLNIELYLTDIVDYRKEDIPFKLMRNIKELPFDDSSFDYVMFNDVLHHMDNVESLLIEGNRVANKIVIFEDCKNWFLTPIDKYLNYLYCPKMHCPLNFKTKSEWEILFDKLGFFYEKGTLSYPFWYPLSHMAFRLTINR